MTEGWGVPPTSQKFTESLSLKGSSRGTTRNLLDLSGGLHFSGITVWCSIRDGDLANELVSMCSDTLEYLCTQYCQGAFLTGSAAEQYGLIAPRRFIHGWRAAFTSTLPGHKAQRCGVSTVQSERQVDQRNNSNRQFQKPSANHHLLLYLHRVGRAL